MATNPRDKAAAIAPVDTEGKEGRLCMLTDHIEYDALGVHAENFL